MQLQNVHLVLQINQDDLNTGRLWRCGFVKHRNALQKSAVVNEKNIYVKKVAMNIKVKLLYDTMKWNATYYYKENDVLWN